jgi:hypothetical protein
MKKLVSLVVLIGLVGMFAGLTMAADEPATPKDHAMKGTVVKVEEGVVTLKVTRKTESTEIKIKTDDKTAVTVDGTAAKVADLKAGMNAEVTKPRGKDTVATKIVATTATASAPAK